MVHPPYFSNLLPGILGTAVAYSLRTVVTEARVSPGRVVVLDFGSSFESEAVAVAVEMAVVAVPELGAGFSKLPWLEAIGGG
jgi:hypothetical protein